MDQAIISESAPSSYHVSGQVKTISQPHRQRATGGRGERGHPLRGGEKWKGLTECGVRGGGMAKRREKGGIKEAFCQYSVFQKGASCKSSGLLGERIKLTIIRSLREKWLQIKKSCGLSSPASFTFSTNCSSFALLLYCAAVPLLKSSLNRST